MLMQITPEGTIEGVHDSLGPMVGGFAMHARRSRYGCPLCIRPEVPRGGQFQHAMHVLRIPRQGTLQTLRKLGWRLILVEIDAPDIRNFNTG
jgi:hypothetical protein